MTQVKLRLPEVSEETPPWVMPWNAERLANESVRRSVELSSMAFQDCRDGLRHRRMILGLSFVGIFSMGLMALYGRVHSHKVKRSHPRVSGGGARCNDRMVNAVQQGPSRVPLIAGGMRVMCGRQS